LSSFPPSVLFGSHFVVRGDDFSATQQQLAYKLNVMRWMSMNRLLLSPTK
jgi:hypothetical protein